MRDLSRQGYTSEEILAALLMKYGTREVRFRYDLLDENEQKKGELYEVESAEITFSAFSDIKRSARISLREEHDVQEETRELALAEIGDTLLKEM